MVTGASKVVGLTVAFMVLYDDEVEGSWVKDLG